LTLEFANSILLTESSRKAGFVARLFCAKSTYNAFFSTGCRGIRGALIV
jgi:hypothetical protein